MRLAEQKDSLLKRLTDAEAENAVGYDAWNLEKCTILKFIDWGDFPEILSYDCNIYPHGVLQYVYYPLR